VIFTRDVQVRNEVLQLKSGPFSHQITELAFTVGDLDVIAVFSSFELVLAQISLGVGLCQSKGTTIESGCSLNPGCVTNNQLSKQGAQIGGAVAVSGGVTIGGTCLLLSAVMLCYRRKKTTNKVKKAVGDDGTAKGGIDQQSHVQENPLFIPNSQV